MARLHERQTYLLPNGTLVIAVMGPAARWELFTPGEWGRCTTANFGVDPDGHVTYQGKLTRWTARDLRRAPAALRCLAPAAIVRLRPDVKGVADGQG